MLSNAVAFYVKKKVIFMLTVVPQVIIQGWYAILNLTHPLYKLRKEDLKPDLKKEEVWRIEIN